MAGRFATWWSFRRQRLHALRLARAPARVPFTIRLIATGNLLKAVAFLFLGLGISRLVHAPDAESWASTMLAHVHIDPDGQRAQRIVAWLSSVSHHRLVEVGAGVFGYAVLYAIEGAGLWFDRPWAEWLTVVGTAVFIPFEVLHLVHRPSLGIVVILLINLAVAGYLGRRLWVRRAV